MRKLILGGSGFLSRAVAEEALRRGHEVVCAARGQRGPVPTGADMVVIDRNEPEAYRALAGERFDTVVDVASFSYPWVAEALAALADRVGHWTFVSSVNVYRDAATVGQRADAPVHAPLREAWNGERPVNPDRYGAVKVACEDAVRARFGDRGFVVRPGLITGPGDLSDRFGYWPSRLSKGGRVLVPEDTGLLTQYIDVRDLAGWIVSAGEQGLSGTYDGMGPAQSLTGLVHEMAEVLGADAELVIAKEQALTEAGVQYEQAVNADGVRRWIGQKSLPLWAPVELAGYRAHDATDSLAVGLRPRSLADAVAGAMDQERKLGLDRKRKAGLTLAEEAGVLATLA
ncbi:MAG TPA: NAD-dependent epimerase/dehydratase family protein [Pseudonocardiaceae bacterium]|nr:NAD-dependent epimerase/dehydratase family protein [Pseudonocardiaceae bacterium]